VPARLDNPAIRALLAVLDKQLSQLESTPGPIGRLALTAVVGLTEIYGEALTRTLALADPVLIQRMLDDELLWHLLALHGLHPEPVQERVARAIEALRATLTSRGVRIELTSIEHGVATVRVSIQGCSSHLVGIERAVRHAVLATAPELAGVTTTRAAPSPTVAFVPLASLTHAPAPARTQ
jgi:Fe-S cluster biogenesis protein NfuA